MKRVISLILSIVMLFSIAGIAAGAEQPVQVNEVQEESKEPNFFDKFTHALTFFKYGIKNTRLYLKDTDRENIGEFCIDYERGDGTPDMARLGAFYNYDTGEVFSSDYDKGVFGSGFGYNAIHDQFYATNDCWQRQFGFTPIYDLLAKVAFDYTTKRIFFEYGGKDWMIQIWKGNYVFNMFVGGEVGLYNRPDGKFGMHYDCATDEEMMPISIDVYDSENTYVDRDAILTWWATGFKLAKKVEPDTLTLESSLTFPDQEMCDAFVEAATKIDGVECTCDGTTAAIKW